MNKDFESDMNFNEDFDRKVKCLTLSNGANVAREYKWIVDNFDEFRKRSIFLYNNVIKHIEKKLKTKLFLIVNEENEYEFSNVNKHFGIWHKYRDYNLSSEYDDIYVNNRRRLNYKKLNELKDSEMPVYTNEMFIMSAFDDIKGFLERINPNTSVFDYFYSCGSVIVEMRDLYSEGNALDFYSKKEDDLNLIFECAKAEGFVLL